MESAAEGVHADVNFLAGAHFAELRFFEIGGDPDVLRLADGEELFAGCNALANLYCFFSDDARDGRKNFCVRKIELGLACFGFCG